MSLAVAVSACGNLGQPPVASEPRVIRLVATNFGYEPSQIEVRHAETIRFIVENRSDLPHELFIGSLDAQVEHASHHAVASPQSRPSADARREVYVPAGGVGQLEFRFDNPADNVIGCHLIGHWESGMRADVVFVP